ncbi:hypothetical protein [Paenibacillus radicis (ex Gao et al. 2016)]|uniref:Uncharacterized protein n=1 Tax=Paenibacillus radicis (ex Gao et al. 2016) TaxID=1737354 RepID=A0A917H0L4_9BACL|nr:hypothetical protein [Paenibacillus radicis (ex Gao et al. 2016)]GGG63679.1 hypothetical protein GCM10010918_17080 [Paenibacillus radicis (ex Gao et al. 2016)]
MDKQFFDEMRKISHEDELRSKLLMHGMKRLLEEKQEKKVYRGPLAFWARRKALRQAETYVAPWNPSDSMTP